MRAMATTTEEGGEMKLLTKEQAAEILEKFDNYVQPNPAAPVTDHWRLKSILMDLTEKSTEPQGIGAANFTLTMKKLSGTRK
jgi:hypothetical protein